MDAPDRWFKQPLRYSCLYHEPRIDSSLQYHPAIAAPTLIVHSRQDALFPDEHRVLSEGIRSSQLSAIEECGHASILEKPEIVTELIRSFIENR